MNLKQALQKDLKYRCPQLLEVWEDLMTGEEWPPKKLEGQLLVQPQSGGWSQSELDGVMVQANGLPLFVSPKLFPLFRGLMEREVPLVELKALKPEGKLLSVVEGMLNIQSYIENHLVTGLQPML